MAAPATSLLEVGIGDFVSQEPGCSARGVAIGGLSAAGEASGADVSIIVVVQASNEMARSNSVPLKLIMAFV